MYAEVKEEERWIGGRGRLVYPRTLLSNLLFLCRSADNEVGHVTLEKNVPELVEYVSDALESPSTQSTDRLWRGLVQLDCKVSCRLVRSLLNSAESNKHLAAPSWVMLSEVERPATFQCEQCQASFVERKALLRHVRQAHELPPLLNRSMQEATDFSACTVTCRIKQVVGLLVM